MKIYTNVLDSNVLSEVFQDTKDLLYRKNGWSYNEYTWPENIRVGVASGSLVAPTRPELQEKILANISKHLPFKDGVEYNISIKHNLWLRNSAVSWHDDRIYEFAATIYLNKDWNASYGGLFIWSDNQKLSGELKAFCPEFNSMVVNDNRCHHLVTTVSPLSPENRITLQVWAKKNN